MVPGPASPEVARAGTEIAVIFGENRTDSLVEGQGFEPTVPIWKESVSLAVGKCQRCQTWRARKALSFLRTDGSIPPPSSGESIANPTFAGASHRISHAE